MALLFQGILFCFAKGKLPLSKVVPDPNGLVTAQGLRLPEVLARAESKKPADKKGLDGSQGAGKKGLRV